MTTFTVVDDVACASALEGQGGRHVLRCKACSDEDLRRMTTRVRCQGWSPQHFAAVRAAEAGDECGSGRGPDLNVRAKGGEQWREGWRIGVLDVKGLEGKPVRR
jgi:hypothetical protein